MGALKPGMTHSEAAEHLREEIIGTLRHETGPLVDEAKFFGAMRAIMCDLDYVAALFDGLSGPETNRYRREVRYVYRVRGRARYQEPRLQAVHESTRRHGGQVQAGLAIKPPTTNRRGLP